jgi:hypothetical protein
VLKCDGRLTILVLILGSLMCGTSAASWMSADAYPRFHIVVSEDASESEQFAANEFQKYWELTTGTDIDVGNEPGDGVTVWIGREGVPAALLGNLELDGLGNDGLCIRTDGNNLLIVGGKLRGTMYGVYQFFEDYMGVRWVTSEVTHIPDTPPEELPEIDFRYVPPFEYRMTSYIDALQDSFSKPHKLTEGPGFGLFVHSFYSLVPPEKYFKDHPEYYALVDGERKAVLNLSGERWQEAAQLCLTNPDLVEIVVDELRRRIKANPSKKIWSVSQMDCVNNCECDNCKALDEREGTPMGSLLTFVNQVADEIGKESPDVYIETIAYWYTRKPPKTIKPRDNVIVRLCTIECDFARPIAEKSSEENRRLMEDIEGWSKIAKTLYIWDYTTNFHNFQTPHPNFQVLQPNIKMFAGHNVRGVFEQGAMSYGCEFAYLRAYIIVHCLWNPAADAEKLKNEFIELYYKEAGPFIHEYIDLITRKVLDNDVIMGCFDRGDWIDYDLVTDAEKIFARAFSAVEDPEVRDRLKLSYLPVQYAALICPPRIRIADGVFTLDRPPSLTLEEYYDLIKSYGVQHIIDYFPLEDFLDQIGRKTPPRHLESTIETIENERYSIWVTPGLAGSVIRWTDKRNGMELLTGYRSYSRKPGTWQEWDITPDREMPEPEHPVADEYKVVGRTPACLMIGAELDDGLVVERTMTLKPGSDTLEVTLTISNPTPVAIVPNVKVHPEFWTQGETVPEIWVEDDQGWRKLTIQKRPEERVRGDYIEPDGLRRWAFTIPDTSLTVVNAFRADELGSLLYFYNADDEHVNLELLPDRAPLQPGATRSIHATYMVTSKHVTDL